MGLLEAVTPEAAMSELDRRGWRILSLLDVCSAASDASKGRSRAVHLGGRHADQRRPRLNLRNRSLYTIQQATMCSAGIPFARSLDAISAGEPPEVAEVARRLQSLVLSGHSLADAMGRMPEAFDPVYVNLIRIGERTGALPRVLERLAEELRRNEERRSWLRSALAYPLFTVLISGAMVGFICYYMLPRFLSIFASLGGHVPWLTRLVMAVASPTTGCVVASLAAAVALWWVLASRSAAGRMQIQDALFGCPVVGPLLHDALHTRISRSLSLMLASGLPVNQALRLLVNPTSGYHRMDAAIREIAEDLEHEGDIVAAFTRCPLMPRLLVDMLRLGTETGDVRKFLDNYAKLADLKLQMAIETMIGLTEPLTIVVLGIVVGIIVLSVFLPVYQLLVTL